MSHRHRFPDRSGRVTCQVRGCTSRHQHRFDIDSPRAKYVRCRCGAKRRKVSHGILFRKSKTSEYASREANLTYAQGWWTPHRQKSIHDIRPTSSPVVQDFSTPKNVQAERQGWVVAEIVNQPRTVNGRKRVEEVEVPLARPMSPREYERAQEQKHILINGR